MRWLICGLLLSLTACTTSGLMEQYTVTEESETITGQETQTIDKPKPRYPGNTKRDWPQRWEKWHRYATFVTCDTGGDKVVCSYVLCNYDLVPYEEHSPRYAGRHVTPERENRYYISRCSMVNLDQLDEEHNNFVEW